MLHDDLVPYQVEVFSLIDSVYSDAALPKFEDGRKPKRNPLNDNFHKGAFQELWSRINRKAVYRVEFDTAELIQKCIGALNSELRVTKLQYTVQTGIQSDKVTDEQLRDGTGFTVTRNETVQSASARSAVKYDLLGKVSDATDLLRQTVAQILTGIGPAIFDQYRANPEHFISEAARLIKEQKAARLRMERREHLIAEFPQWRTVQLLQLRRLRGQPRSELHQYGGRFGSGRVQRQLPNSSGEIARHGFSPMDRSLLLWGAARARANLRQNPEIDHTSCLQSVYLELERFDATKNIDPRPIEPPKAKKIPATEGQMRATLEFDSRLATFFRTGDWSARRDASELMFRWPLTYIDRHQAGLLTGAELELQNSDQWQTRRGDLPPIFAQRVGCYLFQPGAEGRSSQMIGLVDLGTEASSRESILRLTFDDAESSASSARVRQFEIIDLSSADSGLNLIKARHGTSCGGSSWRPTTLSN